MHSVSDAEQRSTRGEAPASPASDAGWLAAAEKWTVVTLFATLMILGCFQIANRHFFRLPIWNLEQLMPQLLMAMIFLGLSLSYQRRAHLAVELLPQSIPEPTRRWYLIGVWVVNAGFLAAVALIAAMVMQFQIEIDAVTNMGYPAAALTGCLVTGCLLSIVRIWQREIRPLLRGGEPAQ